jgi:hypothetical protein
MAAAGRLIRHGQVLTAAQAHELDELIAHEWFTGYTEQVEVVDGAVYDEFHVERRDEERDRERRAVDLRRARPTARGAARAGRRGAGRARRERIDADRRRSGAGGDHRRRTGREGAVPAARRRESLFAA